VVRQQFAIGDDVAGTAAASQLNPDTRGNKVPFFMREECAWNPKERWKYQYGFSRRDLIGVPFSSP